MTALDMPQLLALAAAILTMKLRLMDWPPRR